MSTDIFRPRTEPARTLYDAFHTEAEHRAGRSIEDWITAERKAVWRAARDYAQQFGLQVPTLADVERAESSAKGHCDYGAKWAYYLADVMLGNSETLA